jgi:hypothetical protein
VKRSALGVLRGLGLALAPVGGAAAHASGAASGEAHNPPDPGAGGEARLALACKTHP